MDHTTKKAADRVNKHREDGEEALKRAGKVVPINAGQNRESVQVTADSDPQSGEKESKKKESPHSHRE